MASGGFFSAPDNKDAPVRLCGPAGAHHFELKCVTDATANPYLVLASVIAAGLEGVRDGAELTSGDCTKPAAFMSEDERRAVGLDASIHWPFCTAGLLSAVATAFIVASQYIALGKHKFNNSMQKSVALMRFSN
ncbi:predicted protein [Postia placenta Mad-698-R]|nr:predicted protein [Postia placenta Mad-698-R]